MLYHSVGGWDELHESEVSQSLMFCFDSASSESFCFVVNLVGFILHYVQVAVLLNVTRRERNLPLFASKGKQCKNRKDFTAALGTKVFSFKDLRKIV